MREFLVYLLSYDSDPDGPKRRIPRSRFLVKPPCAAPDPNPDVHEFPVKLNPKLPDPDVFARNLISYIHISFLAATTNI